MAMSQGPLTLRHALANLAVHPLECLRRSVLRQVAEQVDGKSGREDGVPEVGVGPRTARTLVALDEWDAVIAATLASSAQIGRSVATSLAPLLPEMRSFAWTARAVSIDPQTDNNTTTGEVAAQTALYPPRLTTVAWPGPPAEGTRLEYHGRLSSQWLPAVYLLAVAAGSGGSISSAAEPVKRRTPHPHMAS